jgi:hypothetical protein
MLIILNFLKAFYPSIIQKYVDLVFEEYSLHIKILLFIIAVLSILWSTNVIGPKPVPRHFVTEYDSYDVMMVEYFCNDGYIEKYPTSEPLPEDLKKKECVEFYEVACTNGRYTNKHMIEVCEEYKKTGKFFYEERISEKTRILDKYDGREPMELLKESLNKKIMSDSAVKK